MAREGRGLICLALTPERCDELGLDLMAAKNESRVRDRVHRLDRGARRRHDRHLRRRPRAHDRGRRSTPATSPRDLVQPGPRVPAQGQGRRRAGAHRARPRRRSTSRGSPGLTPAGVICEIMNDDGTMARVPDLEGYCARHGLEDDHGRRPDRLPAPPRPARRARRRPRGCRPASASSRSSATARSSTTSTTSRWSRARSTGVEDVLVRVHSECLTGDVFHSLRCDCGEQLESALAMIEEAGPRRAALPRPGGARDRAAEQAARLQPAGPGARHRRREPRARAAGRPARLRHRRADPRRSRARRASASSRTTRRRSAGSRATGCR